MSTAMTLPIHHAHAAGIDLGSAWIFVSVDGVAVERFPTFTADLQRAVAHLQKHGCTTVAMEATGVYWVSFYELLERSGIDVCLCNGAHAKNLPGRKSDVQDCQWLQRMHTYGLLRPSFVPPETMRLLRTYTRLRDDHIEQTTMHTLRMQKALEQMNIKIHLVLSQLHGESGIRMVRAMVAGERDAERLLALCDRRIITRKAEAMRAALEGVYRSDHLFVLRQALESWDFYQGQIRICEGEMRQLLTTITDDLPPSSTLSAPHPTRHHQPDIDDLHEKVTRLCNGENPAAITGISDILALKILAETGVDYSHWKTPKHFTSWMHLAPRQEQSGSKTRKARAQGMNRAGQLFRQAAQSLANSKYTALGAFYRRLKAKHGPRVAMKAVARKLAVQFYNVMVHGVAYVEAGVESYQQKYEETVKRHMARQAKRFGMELVAVGSMTPTS
jgi:transposase